MKKRWIWFLLPVVALVGIGVVLGMPKPPTTVATHCLESQTVEQTVVCNGVVEAGESESVFFPFPCIFREVSVHVGQQVDADTVVAVLDKEAIRGYLGDDASLLALAATDEEVKAPACGIAVAVKAKPGEVLEMGAPCVTVAPRSALQVRVSIREKDLPRLKTGMSVYVSGDGFHKERYHGTLTEISYTAATGGAGATVEGVITLADGQADDSLRLGLTAKAAVVIKTVTDGLVVPYEAVKSDSDGKDYVYVVEKGRAVRRDLSVAAQLGEGLLLADTSLQGFAVIMHPNEVSDGAAVTEDGI